jgi:hypothetical protein
MIDHDILARYPAAREAVVQGLSEPEYAEWQRRAGVKVVESRGRFWREIFPGFYETLPYLARMTAHEAHRPTPLSWGFKATLGEGDFEAASGLMTVDLLRDLSGYGEHSVRKNRRGALRRCLKSTAVVQLTDASILCSQGFQVYLSYAARLGVRRPLSHAEYLRMVNQWFDDPRRLIMAGILGGELLGYQHAFAVGPTVYLWQIHVASSSLPTNISSALYYESLDAYRRSGVAIEACAGLHRPENPGLSSFKKEMGFELVTVPVCFHAPRMVTEYLKRRRPNTYYRFTGDSSGLVPSTRKDPRGRSDAGKTLDRPVDRQSKESADRWSEPLERR